uniref:(California timema) hypothetical protein n=1 Tax=Timema californicum TaxID=61474 RepID=A0A7R9J2M7_TIMCA|nr:unnamed protein product [Timema californicum]
MTAADHTDYNSPMATLVLTDSSQLTVLKLPDQIMYHYVKPNDLQKHAFSSCHLTINTKEAMGYCSIRIGSYIPHRNVVLKLRSSCITMSEEEVAKMSVKLLNCQSATEGRQQFPCTDDMVVVLFSIIMWNTYHLMNNRALAVCHSVKNMQFRALNEMTVNKLMTAAHDQLASMESLKESQVKVQTMTSHTLESVAKNNTVLMSQQDKLFSMQHNIKDFVALNLRELTREKALIAAGHQEIAKLTADIKKSVELTSVSAATQRVEWQENHKELLLQIDKIKNNINAVLDGIELRTQLITSHNDMVTTHHKVLMENLAKINGTVNFLLNIVDRSRDEFNARLGWIASRVTGTADSLDQVYIFALHGAYLIVGMIISSFVNVPNFTRMFLLLIVILNVILSLQKGPYSPMDFFTMTVLMVASIAVQLFVQTAQAYFGPKNLAALTYSTKSNSPKNCENFVPPANPTQSFSWHSSALRNAQANMYCSLSFRTALPN